MVSRGKESLYLSNDEELSAHVISKAVEDKTIRVPGTGVEFTGNELRNLLHSLIEYDRVISALSRMAFDKEIVEAMLAAEIIRRADFEDLAKLEDLQARIDGMGHEVQGIAKDDTHGLYELTYLSSTRGRRELVLNFELVQSVEFRQLRTLIDTVSKLGDGPILVTQGKDGQEKAVASKEELLHQLMEAGRKGLSIQRYKGLGEMNADQLWETTMDPAARRLLEVRINDAVEADEMFSVLMGDAVEPRRQFIEDNALEVKNLDV
jgi:DNA gyrase subunit B